MTQRPRHQRGRCRVCGRLVALTADGRVARHNGTIRAYAPPEECTGGGQRAGEPDGVPPTDAGPPGAVQRS